MTAMKTGDRVGAILASDKEAMNTMVIVEQRVLRGHWPWALVRRPGMPDAEAWGVLDLYVAIDPDDIDEHDNVREGAEIHLDRCGANEVDEWTSEAEARVEYTRLVVST